MKPLKLSGLGVCALTFASLTSGCGGTDASDDAEVTSLSGPIQDEAAVARRFQPRDPSVQGTGGAGGSTAVVASTGGAGGSTAMVASAGGASSRYDCSICESAQKCCNAVSGGPLCTYSAATCSAYPPTSQPYYVSSCVTLLRTTMTAWASAQQTPPAICILSR